MVALQYTPLKMDQLIDYNTMVLHTTMYMCIILVNICVFIEFSSI